MFQLTPEVVKALNIIKTEPNNRLYYIPKDTIIYRASEYFPAPEYSPLTGCFGSSFKLFNNNNDSEHLTAYKLTSDITVANSLTNNFNGVNMSYIDRSNLFLTPEHLEYIKFLAVCHT